MQTYLTVAVFDTESFNVIRISHCLYTTCESGSDVPDISVLS